jgi:hypothetical protein
VDNSVSTEDWKLLLRFVLAQRLEMNAIESALKSANVLTDSQIKDIRVQASETAKAWTAQDTHDALTLIRIHSSPDATMLIPLGRETKDELRREIDDQTPQR